MDKLVKIFFGLMIAFFCTLTSAQSQHVVTHGESLMTISNQYYQTHQKWQAILNANPLIDPLNLTVGDTLIIPDFEAQAKPHITADEPTKVIPNLQPKKAKTVHIAKEQPSLSHDKDFQKLQKAFLQLKNDYQNLKAKSLNSNSDSLSQSNNNLKKQLVKCEGEKSHKYVQQLHNYANLANSQAKILQEKARLLNQRYWLIKNAQPETCNLSFAPTEQYKKDIFENFVEFLNNELGTHRVFVEPTENKIIFHVKGKAVYNYENPKLRNSYKKFFDKLDDYVKALPVASVEIVGHTDYNQVYSEGKRVDGSSFILKQADSLKDFLVTQYGWPDDKFTVSSFGNTRMIANESERKRFEFELRFAKDDVSRGIAAIESDDALANIGHDILKALHEPKYSKLKIGKHGLEINLARSYFFESNSSTLSVKGQERLATLVDIFSKVDDGLYQIIWAPGFLETDKSQYLTRSISQLESIKSYFIDSLKVPKGQIQTGLYPHHKKLKSAFTAHEDKINRRIVFKIKPNSVVTKPINMQK